MILGTHSVREVQYNFTWCTNSSTFNNCTLCPHCIYVFCIYLRTNSDLCHLQHKLTGFYSRDEKCLQRGTDWVFIYNSDKCSYRVKLRCDVHTWWQQTAAIRTYDVFVSTHQSFVLTDCFIVITAAKLGVAAFRLVTPYSLVGDINVSKERKVFLLWRWQALTAVRDI